jgi:hypothetical protein
MCLTMMFFHLTGSKHLDVLADLFLLGIVGNMEVPNIRTLLDSSFGGRANILIISFNLGQDGDESKL